MTTVTWCSKLFCMPLYQAPLCLSSTHVKQGMKSHQGHHNTFLTSIIGSLSFVSRSRPLAAQVKCGSRLNPSPWAKCLPAETFATGRLYLDLDDQPRQPCLTSVRRSKLLLAPNEVSIHVQRMAVTTQIYQPGFFCTDETVLQLHPHTRNTSQNQNTTRNDAATERAGRLIQLKF